MDCDKVQLILGTEVCLLNSILDIHLPMSTAYSQLGSKFETGLAETMPPCHRAD